MAIENQTIDWTIQSSIALNNLTAGTGHIHKAISQTGTLAANGDDAIGILQYGAGDGEHIGISVFGISKYVATGSIANGAKLTVTTSGYFTTAASGSSVVGRNLIDTVASGAVGVGFFSFHAPDDLDISSAQSAERFQGFTAQANLSAAGAVGKIINATSGDFAGSGRNAMGILVTGTVSGGTSQMRCAGIWDALAGGVIATGESLTSNASGWAIKADSGSMIIGRAVDASAAGNSGSAFTGVWNFATPHYATSCLDVQYL